MMCEHYFVEAVATKLDYEKSDNGRIETVVRRKVCYKCYKTKTEIDLEQQLAAATRTLAELEADLNESHVDEHGTVWTRPTAEAYCLICKAYDTWKTKAEQAEAQCAAMRNCLEELSCLGSRTGRGNSIGNDIASRMLDKTDAGTAILDRLRRMEKALREIAACKTVFNTEVPYIVDKNGVCICESEITDIAKAALEEKP